MFKLRCLVSDLFYLEFRIFSKLSRNIIDKNLRIPKVFLEENFKVRQYNKSSIFVVILILGVSKANNTTKNEVVNKI